MQKASLVLLTKNDDIFSSYNTSSLILDYTSGVALRLRIKGLLTRKGFVNTCIIGVAELLCVSSSERPNSIDITTLPKKAPTAVVEQIPTVLAIQGQTFVSAVKIADNRILTARHVFGDNPESPQCREIYVWGKKYGFSNLRRAAAPPQKDNYQPDIVLVEAEQIPPFIDLPDAKIASHTPNQGEPLFFLNYEPDAHHKIRSPYTSDKRYADPAFFGGLLLNQQSDGTLYVLTGLNDYNTIDPNEDTEGRPGASGGPVFNSNGEIIGISISGTKKTLPASSIMQETGIVIRGERRNQLFQITNVEPVTPTLIQTMENELVKLPFPANCYGFRGERYEA